MDQNGSVSTTLYCQGLDLLTCIFLEAHERKTQHILNTILFLNTAVCRMQKDEVMYCIYLWVCGINNCNMMMVKQIKLCLSNVTVNTLIGYM